MALVALYLPVTGKSRACSKKLALKVRLSLRSTKSVISNSAPEPKRITFLSVGKKSSTIGSAGTKSKEPGAMPSAICIFPLAISERSLKKAKWASPTKVTMAVFGRANSDKR